MTGKAELRELSGFNRPVPTRALRWRHALVGASQAVCRVPAAAAGVIRALSDEDTTTCLKLRIKIMTYTRPAVDIGEHRLPQTAGPPPPLCCRLRLR